MTTAHSLRLLTMRKRLLSILVCTLGCRTETPKSMTGEVEILLLRSGYADALMQLFEEVSRDAASVHFHPHPFDAELIRVG